MSDLVDKQSVYDTLTDYYHHTTQTQHDALRDALCRVPSVQRNGRIIIRSNMLGGEDCYCSKCYHWALLPDYKFCPYCGVAFEDVISERETMEEFMYGQDMGNPEDGSL